MARIWFEPLERPPFYQERRSDGNPPPGKRILEISSRSSEQLGRGLSAMNLRDAATGKPVEAIYQAAKCYGGGGPAETIRSNGFEAKRDDGVRRRAGALRGFEHEGVFWPTSTGTQFYDRLWMRAALAHGVQDVAYDGYSDMFFSPRAMACQARSMAMLQGIIRARMTDRIEDPEQFSALMRSGRETNPEARKTAPGKGEIRIAICADGRFEDPELVERKLNEILHRAEGARIALIDTGGDGAEIDAARWAEARGISHRSTPDGLLETAAPHLVVEFTSGGRNHRLTEVAARRGVAIEQVDGHSETTLTANGRLTALDAIARGRAQLTPAENLTAPAPADAARIDNPDPTRDGEIRVAIRGGGEADRTLIRAKLEELRERAAPAALRLACQQASRAGSTEHEVETWARRTGTHCDRYRRADELASPAENWKRLLDEQKPHLVATFGRGDEGTDRAIAAALERRIPVEQTDTGGRTWTATGGRVAFAKDDRYDGKARPNPAFVNPIAGRSAAQAARRLPGRAREAAWAQPHARGPKELVLNLRHPEARAAVAAGRAVRVDRQTEWGNPFVLERNAGHEERIENIERYRDYLAAGIDSGRVDPERLAALDGKKVACHCAPEDCHSEVLAAAASWANTDRRRSQEKATPAKAERNEPRKEPPAQAATPAKPEKPGETPTETAGPAPAATAGAPRPQGPDTDPFERRRAALERMGASVEQLNRYDDAVTDHYMTAVEEIPTEERIAGAVKKHPASAGARAIEEHREQLKKEGTATEAQLERLAEQAATLRATARQAATIQESEGGKLDESQRRTVQSAAEPVRVANEIARELGKTSRPYRRRLAPAAQAPPPRDPGPPSDDTPRREVRVAVCGARRFGEIETLREKLDEVRRRADGAPLRLITGGTTGAETAAARWAAEAGVPCDEYPPDWEQHQRAAAYRRNPTIIEHGQPHVVVSFQRGDNPVGDDLIALAEANGIPIEEVADSGKTSQRGAAADLAAIGRRESDEPRQAPEPASRPKAASGWTMDALYREFAEEKDETPAQTAATSPSR